MLVLTVPERRVFIETELKFVNLDAVTLKLEHSLLSVSKWESKYCKPFISKDKKTREEMIGYMKCMTVHPLNLPEDFYNTLTPNLHEQIEGYINSPMTATVLPKNRDSGSREIITTELIYYWMIANQIPFECQKWHLNRLLTLITVCTIKNTPKKKLSKNGLLTRNYSLNEQRKKQLNTKG